MRDLDNPDVDPNRIYSTYGGNAPTSPVLPSEVSPDAVTGVIAGGGGSTVGGSITVDGGSTGYQFQLAGNVLQLFVNSASTIRTSIGLGTIATQNANNVSISGGTITGIADLAVADGGTGASNASGARSNLGAAASGDNSDITKLLGLTGGLRFIGYTSSTADPTTTELPTDKDTAIHKNTTSTNVFLAFNDGGSIKKVQLT